MAYTYALKTNADARLELSRKRIRVLAALAAGTTSYVLTATDEFGWSKDFTGVLNVGEDANAVVVTNSTQLNNALANLGSTRVILLAPSATKYTISTNGVAPAQRLKIRSQNPMQRATIDFMLRRSGADASALTGWANVDVEGVIFDRTDSDYTVAKQYFGNVWMSNPIGVALRYCEFVGNATAYFPGNTNPTNVIKGYTAIRLTGYDGFVIESNVGRNFGFFFQATGTTLNNMVFRDNYLTRMQFDYSQHVGVSTNHLYEYNYFGDPLSSWHNDSNTTAGGGNHGDYTQWSNSGYSAPTRNITVRFNVYDSRGAPSTQAIFFPNEAVNAIVTAGTGTGEEMYSQNITVEDNVVFVNNYHGITLDKSKNAAVRRNLALYDAGRTKDDPELPYVKPFIQVLGALSTGVVEFNTAPTFKVEGSVTGANNRELNYDNKYSNIDADLFFPGSKLAGFDVNTLAAPLNDAYVPTQLRRAGVVRRAPRLPSADYTNFSRQVAADPTFADASKWVLRNVTLSGNRARESHATNYWGMISTTPVVGPANMLLMVYVEEPAAGGFVFAAFNTAPTANATTTTANGTLGRVWGDVSEANRCYNAGWHVREVAVPDGESWYFGLQGMSGVPSTLTFSQFYHYNLDVVVPSYVVVTGGQSNSAYLYTYGRTAFEESLRAVSGTRPVALIDGATPGTAMLRSSVASGATNYWVDDTDVNNLVLGPAWTKWRDAVQAQLTANNTIIGGLWDQGEGDAGRLGTAAVRTVYQTAMLFVFAQMRALVPGLQIFVTKMGRRGDGPSTTNAVAAANITGYQILRNLQRTVIDAYDYVHATPERYDFETDGGAHLRTADPSAYPAFARRVARKVAKVAGLTVSHGVDGPVVVGASRNAKDIVVTLAHDTGATDFTGTSGFRYTTDDVERAIASITRVDATHVRLTLADTPSGVEKLYYGWGILDGVDYATMIRDNNTYTPLPLQAIDLTPTNITPAPTPQNSSAVYGNRVLFEHSAAQASGQTVPNMIDTPADGVAKTAYDWSFGASPTAGEASDPTIVAAANGVPAYLSTDGGDYVKIVTNTDFLKNLSVDRAHTYWALYKKPSAGWGTSATLQVYGSGGNAGTTVGMQLRWVLSTGQFRWVTADGSTSYNLNATPNVTPPTSEYLLLIATLDPATRSVKTYVNSVTPVASLSNGAASTMKAVTSTIAFGVEWVAFPAGAGIIASGMATGISNDTEAASLRDYLETRYAIDIF